MSTIKGAKKRQGSQRKAVIAPDSAQSKTFLKILYGLSEGQVKGLTNGYKSVYLDDTPLQDANGNWNFQNVQVDFRHGTNDQTYIEGFPSVESETGIGVELKSDAAWVQAFSNTELDAVRVRLKWSPIRQTNSDNGDVTGYTIKYAIDVQTDGGAWVESINTQLSDKTSANYERSHRIDLPKADIGWQIRIRRITPNSTSEYISDKMYVQAVTEIIDAKLRYPNTALLGLQYDAETFSNVAKIAIEMDGVEIRVPTNYDPVTRTYAGLWDGTFKRAYTNNPAWHFYDTCISKRYALGDRINSSMIDKWSVYRIAQYCDQLVSDGKGGQEPRFTLNVYEQQQDDAWSALSKMAGAFRAFIYWDGQAIVCDADIPQDTYFTYTRANAISGHFEYSGTRARDRHTVAKVAWDNPSNRYKTENVIVRDEAAISKLGIRIVDIKAYGCTSEGQAQRAGQWALKSEQLETRTVSFKVGLDGFIPMPGKVIEIADELFTGRSNGGRISAVSADRKTITVDRDDVVCRAGDRLVVNGEDGKAQARIVSSKIGRKITVTVPFDSVAAQNLWVVDAQDLATMKFRVISITQDDKHQFSITALQYNPQKYDAIDHGAFIDDRPISIVSPTAQAAVTDVQISSETMVQQGLAVETMLIHWTQASGATKYQVEWRKDDGNWIKMPLTGNNSVEVQGIYSGNYEARVIALSAYDVASLPTYSVLTTLSGKTGMPPALANLAATGILFGYRLDWNFPAVGALDTAYTEIEIATTANGANAAQLGLFAYPTDTHVIQGMQPNLTRYFRGRLIDRIGNIGPWSSWVSATTSADASAVLDVLSGKISETQLSQGLIEKIENSDLENNQAFIDVQQKIQGLDAQYYLRIQSGKYVSGFGLGVDGGRSDFIVHSDSFALGNPAGGDEGVSYPFIFRTTAYTDPNTGTVFPVGAYLKTAFMDYASVDTAHIKQLAVKSAHIDDLAVKTANIDDLAVTAAKIDSLAVTTAKIDNGAITTAKIGDLQVDTLKIKDNAISIGIGAQGVHTLSTVSNGGKIRLDVGVQAYASVRYHTVYLRVLRNGTVIRVFEFGGVLTNTDNGTFTNVFSIVCTLPPIIETIPAGTTVTYSIQVGYYDNNNHYRTPDETAKSWVRLSNLSMAITELKK